MGYPYQSWMNQPSYQVPPVAPVQQYQQPVNAGINWVSGEAGAKSWNVLRGETVLLMDSENQCFYIKSADPSGMPLPLRVFEYKERTQNGVQGSNQALIQTNDNFITREEFDALKAKYEELEKQLKRPATKKEVKENE